MNIFTQPSGVFPVVVADAHCDIPCGIYDPTPAKIAAKTVARMVMQVHEIKPLHKITPLAGMDAHAIAAHANMIARRIAVKEQHAEACKRELATLWSDFFKQEHLAKNPELHDTVWKALKLCSKNKQEVDEDAANQLVAAVDEIAKIFYEVKGVPERYAAYQTITDKLY